MRLRRRTSGGRGRDRGRRRAAEAGRESRPQFFWLGAVVLLSVVTLGVYRPVCHARSEARARYARVAGEVEALRAGVERQREEREGLERGDPVLWEAAARECGMIRPGETPARRGPAAETAPGRAGDE